MLLFVFLACAPEEVDPPTREPVTPVDTAPEFNAIGTMTVSAQFGYDPVTGTAVATLLDGTPLPPTFDIQLGPPGWNGNISSRVHCEVSYDLTGLPVAPVEGQLLSISIPADTPTTTDCEDLDPEEWGDDPSEAFRPAVLGVQVGTLTPHVQDWLSDQSEPLEFYAGGSFQVADIFGEDTDFAFTNVYETDAHLALEIDGNDLPVRLERAVLEPTPPVGWYTVSSGILWTLQ